jgi:Ca2+-binding RTX toxin-like protein
MIDAIDDVIGPVPEDGSITISGSALPNNDIRSGAVAVTSVGNAVGGSLGFGSSSVIINGRVSSSSSTITFTPTPNYNGPASFTYTVTDGTNSDTATVTLQISPVNDAPTGISGGPLAIAEKSAAGTIVGTVAGQDIDDATFTYTLTDSGGGRFAIDNAGVITVANGPTLNFNSATSHDVTVRATDSGGLSVEKTIAIAVTDVVESFVGSTSDDPLAGGNGSDLLFGGGFAPDGSFLPNSGADTLDGGAGNDGLWGADGNDVLRGGAGSDGLVGGAGNDSLDCGYGVDFLFGGDFSAVDGSFVPNSGDDSLNGGNGNDGLWGFDGNDLINGDAGDDYAEGGLGNDAISGGADNDTLLGQAGADTIGGGAGFDYLYGGLGADVFVFNKGDSYDTVWDFSAAEGDKLRIDPALAGSFAEFQNRLSGFNFEGADFTVFLSADGLDQLTMKGIAHTAWTVDLLA